jgi:UDP-N-acetyl-D-galactosamine dehydrogenase
LSCTHPKSLIPKYHVAYSPERINPGDKVNTFVNITKVVAADTPDICDIVASVYGSVVKHIYKAPSIRVAEMSKVIENTQRDINISLMNELALICNRLDIDIYDVLDAASTKWNFLNFKPGLVGGHCIGVDPWYLIDKSIREGYTPRLLTAARGINDEMSSHVVNVIIKALSDNRVCPREAVVTILGLTFKENCPDLRNSKVFNIINELEKWGIKVQVEDYYITDINKHLKPEKYADCLLLAVPHKEYVEKGWNLRYTYLYKGEGVVVDIKGVLNKYQIPDNVSYYRIWIKI